MVNTEERGMVHTDRAGTHAAVSKAETFRALHRGRLPGDPLVLPGPWDAASAQVFADAGFPALATPSAGVAASLGYEDGATPADEMFAAVARIVRAVDVPVSADVEGGYGLAPRSWWSDSLRPGRWAATLRTPTGCPQGCGPARRLAGRGAVRRR